MIEQVLEEIKLAEEKAAEIKKAADDYASAKNKEAEETANNLLKNAEETVKSMKKEYKAKTVLKENELYKEVLQAAKRDSDALYGSLTSKIDKLADEIAGKVINGNC